MLPFVSSLPMEKEKSFYSTQRLSFLRLSVWKVRSSNFRLNLLHIFSWNSNRWTWTRTSFTYRKVYQERTTKYKVFIRKSSSWRTSWKYAMSGLQWEIGQIKPFFAETHGERNRFEIWDFIQQYQSHDWLMCFFPSFQRDKIDDKINNKVLKRSSLSNALWSITDFTSASSRANETRYQKNEKSMLNSFSFYLLCRDAWQSLELK